MNASKIAAVAVITMVGSGLYGTAANAQPDKYLQVEPNLVDAGGVVHVKGACPEPGEHLVKSTGFVKPIPLGGSGQVANRTGKTPAWMQCGNDMVNTVFFIQQPRSRWSVSVQPKDVQPGAPVKLQLVCAVGAVSTQLKVTSPGFVEDVSAWISYEGVGSAEGKAVSKPGHYTAAFECQGKRLTTTFTVLGGPSGTPTPSTQPTQPAPPQVVVKPKAAPETGGGFLAGSR